MGVIYIGGIFGLCLSLRLNGLQYFFKACKYKNRTFCIKHFAAKSLKTSNIFGNFTNFIRFLLFEKERKS